VAAHCAPPAADPAGSRKRSSTARSSARRRRGRSCEKTNGVRTDVARELERLRAMVVDAMTGVVSLAVPLEVNVSSGKDWAAAK